MPPKKSDGFSAQEKAAMAERARELKKDAKNAQIREEGERDLLAKIAEMAPDEGEIATTLHKLVTMHAPMLWPKTWYGMPAWHKDGKVVCFYQSASKFGVRYNTFGFQEAAALDDGTFWPTGYALLAITPEVEQRIVALIKQATGQK
ncbi:MAG: hypothetical protein RLZZ297_2085 [Chloroflexota bacterium]|jgi:uncharacterized protein YdhG (YjbR/CyaY superfamily)